MFTKSSATLFEYNILLPRSYRFSFLSYSNGCMEYS